MSNEILYILLSDYAAHEVVYLSQAVASDEYALKENPKYVNRVVAPTMEPVKSIGGFLTLPDYSFESIPDDYAALVLIGGFGWATPVAEQVAPIVRNAIARGKIVGAICNAASFMAKCGFLNNVRHTGNGVEQLKLWEERIMRILRDMPMFRQSAIKTSSQPMDPHPLNLRKSFFCCLRTTSPSA